MLDQMIIGNTV